MIFKINWDGLSKFNENIDGIFDENKELIKLGLLIKNKREEYGHSRTELSKRTLISVAVLEAIENAWTEKLPEYAYLSSMLDSLESELNLKPNSLESFLENKKSGKKKEGKAPITFGNINMFSNWQGSFLYFISMMISILLINTQQKQLSIKHSTTIHPLEDKKDVIEVNSPAKENDNKLEVDSKENNL